MVVLNRDVHMCPCCLTSHEVQTVEERVPRIFKDVEFKSSGIFEYCDIEDTFYATEEQITHNDRVIKDDYRKKVGLLTSSEIIAIRKKYGLSQKDFCIVLGWGERTIARYETHQVQERTHDIILRKVSNDPTWFAELLTEAKEINLLVTMLGSPADVVADEAALRWK